MRGALTDQVKAITKYLTGAEFTVRELRLLPYLMHCLLDNSNVQPNKISAEERTILMEWQEKGWIDSPASDFKVTEWFYATMSIVLRVGYCSDSIKEGIDQ